MKKTTQPNKAELSVEQQNAIELLLQGKPDREVAEAVGVSRQTVNLWQNNVYEFYAALQSRRAAIWGAQAERLRGLVAEAVKVLEEDLHSDDVKLRQAAAVHILKAVGLYGADLEPRVVGKTAFVLERMDF